MIIKGLSGCILASCLSVCCFGQIYYPNQEVRINDLPSLTAKSRNPFDVLATAVEIILHDRKVCCGKDSALEDSVQAADPKSLKDAANKLQGRHLLSDGRPIMINAEFVPAASVNPDQLINTLAQKQALLMQWNSHFYVVYGIIYDQTLNQDSGIVNAIHKFLLIDPRYSDARREVVFDRLNDDWGKVQGLLILKVASQ
ncbi:MAG TPA: hypothetical protein VN911_20600 [Candidatus Acidoferrum sp.]|nr:hypothetical protein [Candidatus Acidoferrum sp.]